jgi:hypothetical protein
MQGVINIKGKNYTLISERVRLAHETRESFEMVSSGPLQCGPMTVWQVVIKVNGCQYIGTAEIKFDASPKTADGTNPVACAETSAVGRALGMAGLGSVESIASAEEVMLAQAEQERPPATPTYDASKPATEQQLDTIDRLRAQLGMQSLESTEGLSFGECAQMLRDLSKRVQSMRKAG